MKVFKVTEERARMTRIFVDVDIERRLRATIAPSRGSLVLPSSHLSYTRTSVTDDSFPMMTF